MLSQIAIQSVWCGWEQVRDVRSNMKIFARKQGFS